MTLSKSKPWRKDPPPHNTFVELFYKRRIIKAKAIYGDPNKGVLPHWELEDGKSLFRAGKFTLWRAL